MLKAKDIYLRDFAESDIEKRIYWETIETEWQLWDVPWEYECLTEAEREQELQDYIVAMQQWVEQCKQYSDEQKRYAFQIATNDLEQRYIGWVSSYKIDTDYNYTKDQGYRAVGINIPELSVRGKGYSYQALGVFIQYLLEHGEREIYTQTWSGNTRMMHIAEKIGFEECCRKIGIRTVRGQVYDGLTFKLNHEKFTAFYKAYCGS